MIFCSRYGNCVQKCFVGIIKRFPLACHLVRTWWCVPWFAYSAASSSCSRLNGKSEINIFDWLPWCVWVCALWVLHYENQLVVDILSIYGSLLLLRGRYVSVSWQIFSLSSIHFISFCAQPILIIMEQTSSKSFRSALLNKILCCMFNRQYTKQNLTTSSAAIDKIDEGETHNKKMFNGYRSSFLNSHILENAHSANRSE